MRYALIPVLFLAACSVPHPLSQLDRQGKAQVAGFSFTVNWSDQEAEATRTNVYLSRNVPPVWAAATVAVQDLTGCPVREGSLSGDIALVRMKLACDGDTRPVAETPELECSGFADVIATSGSDLVVDFLCGPRR